MARSHNGRRTAARGGRVPPKPSDLPDRLASGEPVQSKGTLVIIGGGEEKEGDALILREVVRRAGGGKIVVATLATSEPEAAYQKYERAFTALGVRRLEHLDVTRRDELLREPRADILEDAAVVFFTGGDQLRITSVFGGTELCERIQEFYRRGGTVAGTSAGASVMSETMLVSGGGDQSHRVGAALLMAPGLGYIKDVIVDQHFAERGRIGRLLGAVAQNPRLLGVGLDENTAIVVEEEVRFQVVGAGAVYVVDGREVTACNIGEEQEDRTMSIFNVRLHLLSQGDEFDLRARTPAARPAELVERELMPEDGKR